MVCQHSMTGALEALAHNRVVFPNPNNGGCMTLGWPGCVGGVGELDVGIGWGGQIVIRP